MVFDSTARQDAPCAPEAWNVESEGVDAPLAEPGVVSLFDAAGAVPSSSDGIQVESTAISEGMGSSPEAFKISTSPFKRSSS